MPPGHTPAFLPTACAEPQQVSRGGLEKAQPVSGFPGSVVVCVEGCSSLHVLSEGPLPTSTLNQAWCSLFFNLGLQDTQVGNGASGSGGTVLGERPGEVGGVRAGPQGLWEGRARPPQPSVCWAVPTS